MGKKRAKRKANITAPARKPQIYYCMHSLLHTVRAIAQHEDQLCCLLQEIKTTGAVSPALTHELRELLQEMAPAAYDADLAGVWLALEAEAAAS